MTREWMEDVFRFKSQVGFRGVYLSFKQRKKTSKLFGFAKYQGKESAMRVMERTHDLMIGGSKWKVSMARFGSFQRTSMQLTAKERKDTTRFRQTPHPPRHRIPNRKRGNLDGRKFVDVVKNGSGSSRDIRNTLSNRGSVHHDSPEVENLVTIPAMEEANLEWLNRSLIGFTNSGVTIQWLAT